MSHKKKLWEDVEAIEMERKEAGFKDSNKNGMNMSVPGFPLYNSTSLMSPPANFNAGKQYIRIQDQIDTDDGESNNKMK